VSVVASWSRLDLPGFLERGRAVGQKGASLKFYAVEGWARARFASRRRIAGSEREALDLLFSGLPADEVVLETAAAEGGGCGSFAVPAAFPSPERVDVELEAPCGGWLVLAETDAPGWEVRVDGAPATGLRANYAFRAVALGAGRHRVEWRYASAPLRRGAAISVASLALVAAAAFARRRKGESDTILP
jgi:hypothetical protein